MVLKYALRGSCSIGSPSSCCDIGLNAGFASGDANPSDEVYSTFSMDRDFNAGSIIFDLHQAATEVATYNLITDPEHAGNPPDGVEFAVTEGAIVKRCIFNRH